MDRDGAESVNVPSRRSDSELALRTELPSERSSSAASFDALRGLDGALDPSSSKSTCWDSPLRERRERPRSRLKLGISSASPRLPDSIWSDFSTSRGFTEPGSASQFFLRSYSSIRRCCALGSSLGMAVDGVGSETSMAPPSELPARKTSN